MINGERCREKSLWMKDCVKPVEKKVAMREHITLCVAADGGFVQPLVILPLKTLPELSDELCEYFCFTGQAAGWIDGKIFSEYLEKIFIPHVDHLRGKQGCPEQVVLLVSDGHTSRNCVDANKLFEEHRIVVFLLPPHSSAILQPLDLSVNGELKKVFSKRHEPCNDDNAHAARLKVLEATRLALSRVLNLDTITIGFRRTGLWPINAALITENAMVIEHDKDKVTCVKKKQKEVRKRQRAAFCMQRSFLPSKRI
jgi:hypothetical protein